MLLTYFSFRYPYPPLSGDVAVFLASNISTTLHFPKRGFLTLE